MPHGLAWDGARAVAVKGWRLTAWVTARPGPARPSPDHRSVRKAVILLRHDWWWHTGRDRVVTTKSLLFQQCYISAHKGPLQESGRSNMISFHTLPSCRPILILSPHDVPEVNFYFKISNRYSVRISHLSHACMKFHPLHPPSDWPSKIKRHKAYKS